MFLMRPPHLSRVERDMVPALEQARSSGVRHVVLLSLQGADRNRAANDAASDQTLITPSRLTKMRLSSMPFGRMAATCLEAVWREM